MNVFVITKSDFIITFFYSILVGGINLMHI